MGKKSAMLRSDRFRSSGRRIERFRPTAKQKIASRLLHDPSVHSVLFHGGSRSGKTESICRFYSVRAFSYPESNQIVLRKIARSARMSVWESFRRHYSRHVPSSEYRAYDEEMTIYHRNGSIIRCDGLDDSARVENILGTEYITIFLNEATQLSYGFIGMLKTRLAQNCPHAADKSVVAATKLIADCNPRHKRHWLYRLCIKGVNPEIIDEDVPLPESKRWANLHWRPEDNVANLPAGYIETHLDSLPEKIRARMRYGEWISVEGCVYDNYDEDRHVLDHWRPTADYSVYRAIDFGYRNAFACLWIAVREDYKHVVVFDEHYYTRHPVVWHAPKIVEKSRPYPNIVTTICDWEADQRATLEEFMIDTTKADKSLLSGIERVYKALGTEYDGRPLLQITKNCVNTRNEFFAYHWPDSATLTTQALKGKRDEPVDSDNHALSGIRYFFNHVAVEMESLDVLRGLASPSSLIPGSLSGNGSAGYSGVDEGSVFSGGFKIASEQAWYEKYGNEGFGYGD